MKLNKVNIYRITHIDNVPHIMRYGITHHSSENANTNFVAIGDMSLIDARSRKAVPVTNGNARTENVETITLGDLIPFYFGVRMPMLYVVQQGGNFVAKPTLAEDIIYLGCSLSKIIRSQSRFYFTDGHATDGMTTFYDSSMVGKLHEIVDWRSVREKYWGGDENLDTKRKKQAEFLAIADVSFDNVVRLACYNEKAKKKLKSFGVRSEMIHILPRIYY